MADLDFLESSSPVQITGDDESFAADVGERKELSTSNTIRQNLTSGALTVGTTAVEIKVGGTRLANRKSVFLFNNSNKTMYWGDSGVTTTTGIPIARGESVTIAIEDVAVFVITDQAGRDARVVEAL